MRSRMIFSGILQLLILSVLAAVTIGQGESSLPARQLWCVAKNNAEDVALQSAIDWACGQGGADCVPIQNDGPCYDPSDLQRTASYAFNDYYHKRGGGQSDDSCNFSNTAALTDLDPSHNDCKFPSSSINTSNGNLNGPGSEAVSTTNSADLSGSGSGSGSGSMATNLIGEMFRAQIFLGFMIVL